MPMRAASATTPTSTSSTQAWASVIAIPFRGLTGAGAGLEADVGPQYAQDPPERAGKYLRGVFGQARSFGADGVPQDGAHDQVECGGDAHGQHDGHDVAAAGGHGPEYSGRVA